MEIKMVALTFITMLLNHDAAWQINLSGHYKPLRLSEIIVSTKGESYFLNFVECQISHYDPSGKLKGAFGFKGQGPGGFVYPSMFFHDQDSILVFDSNSNVISAFDAEGQFLRRFAVPKAGASLVRVKDGWIYGIWSWVESQYNQKTVYWADNEFKNETRICELESVGSRGGFWGRNTSKGFLATFNPVRNLPKMTANQDGSKLYIAEPESAEIKVIDVAKKAVVSKIQLPPKALPFDNEWGEKEAKKIREKYPQYDIVAQFPDTFPIVRSMITDPSGNLVISRWAGNPDLNYNTICYDDNGQEREAAASWQALKRLAGVVDGWAYVTTFQSERETPGLAKIPLGDLEKFVSENPIVFKGVGGRTFVRE